MVVFHAVLDQAWCCVKIGLILRTGHSGSVSNDVFRRLAVQRADAMGDCDQTHGHGPFFLCMLSSKNVKRKRSIQTTTTVHCDPRLVRKTCWNSRVAEDSPRFDGT